VLARTLGTAAVAAVAVGFAATAWADGMPQYSAVYAPAFSWTGLYIGGNVGWERKRMQGSDFDNACGLIGADGKGCVSDFTTDGTSTASPFKQNLDGTIYGGQIGYNHQFGRYVIGTELSGSWGNVSGNGDCFTQGSSGTFGPVSSGTPDPDVTTNAKHVVSLDCAEKQRWQANWLNKFGIAHGHWMGYLLGGVAISEMEKSRSFGDQRFTQFCLSGECAPFILQTTSTASWSGSAIHAAVVMGAGTQFMIHDNLSLGIEWLHTTYASADYMMSGTITNCTIGTEGGCRVSKFGSNLVQSGDSDTLRLVLNYKFGDHEARPLK
jgi:opacity protein-like surface antigen